MEFIFLSNNSSFQIEHIANVLTHGLWVLPSVYAGLNLYFRSYTGAQMLSAVIYGIALTMLFFVSTFFHCVFYCNRNRQLKDVLHRCDRAMIYIFIAGSYYPWLSLGHTSHPQIVSVVKWCVWAMAILGIIYQQVGLKVNEIVCATYITLPKTFRYSMNDTNAWKPSSIR